MSDGSDRAESDWPVSDPEILDVLQRAWADGSWGRYHGPHCVGLISDLSDFYDISHMLLCSSGTAAVELALRACGVTPGDEVILCGYDFKSNLINVLTTGAIPVLVDSLPEKPVIDPSKIELALSDRTRCIIASHLHGCMASIRDLREIASARGILVIEDACQTPGAMIGGCRAGTLGDIGVLSFGGSKLLTAGRGGAVMTHDSQLAQRMRLYVQRGNDAYPLSELQAAVLRPQLRKLDRYEAMRRDAVRRICDRMTTCRGLRCLSHPLCQTSGSSGESALPALASYYKVPFLVVDAQDRSRLEQLSGLMRQRMIPLDPAFPALHLTHSRRRFRIASELSGAEQLHQQLMVMHHPVLLESSERLDAMAAEIVQIMGSV
ncbi:MAG: aminotransferase class V-fold PLP-dependent enzyme [Planctomyces sp.]|nr:aminotransferase class V-fold PLP-dependent enzyme [Planctomyces sp.]